MTLYETIRTSPPPLRAHATPREGAEDRRTLRDLTVAVRDGGFVLHYLRRLRLATLEPVAAEALLRWPHRRRGLVPPSGFLPLAERHGHANAIGAWMLHRACAAAAGWPSTARVSVNVPERHVVDGSLLRQLADTLEATGLPPDRLEIELPEMLLLDTTLDTLLTLSAIRDLGIGIALDGFAVGAASLSMLKRLPLTAMKLDRSLLRDLPACPEDAIIAHAVIQTGRVLGLTVVAEGIETDDQLAFLRDRGCEEGQGALFGQPAASDDPWCAALC